MTIAPTMPSTTLGRATATAAMAVPSRMIPTPVQAAMLCPWSSCCSSMASSLVRSASGPSGPTPTILSGLVGGVAQGRVPAVGELVPRRADLPARPGLRFVTALVAAREPRPGAARDGREGGAEREQRRGDDREPHPDGARA